MGLKKACGWKPRLHRQNPDGAWVKKFLFDRALTFASQNESISIQTGLNTKSEFTTPCDKYSVIVRCASQSQRRKRLRRTANNDNKGDA